jgi:hypothetical protein
VRRRLFLKAAGAAAAALVLGPARALQGAATGPAVDVETRAGLDVFGNLRFRHCVRITGFRPVPPREFAVLNEELGCCNRATLLGWGPERLRLVGLALSLCRTPPGVPWLADGVDLDFDVNPVGWNRPINPGTGKPVRYRRPADRPPEYQLTSFALPRRLGLRADTPHGEIDWSECAAAYGRLPPFSRRLAERMGWESLAELNRRLASNDLVPL